ncbi:hypothetical protein CBL_14587 [Carabus blaptoides fortunei]
MDETTYFHTVTVLDDDAWYKAGQPGRHPAVVLEVSSRELSWLVGAQCDRRSNFCSVVFAAVHYCILSKNLKR